MQIVTPGLSTGYLIAFNDTRDVEKCLRFVLVNHPSALETTTLYPLGF